MSLATPSFAGMTILGDIDVFLFPALLQMSQSIFIPDTNGLTPGWQKGPG
jgi:hypothetical protein